MWRTALSKHGHVTCEHDPASRREQVWAEMADGSCRWRQTGSEVKIIALRVPPTVSPADVVVDFDPYHLRGEDLDPNVEPNHQEEAPSQNDHGDNRGMTRKVARL